MNAPLKSVPVVHGDMPCTECGDDAELHALRRAHDLLAAGLPLGDDEAQAFDRERWQCDLDAAMQSDNPPF